MSRSFTAFDGASRLSSGSLPAVAGAAWAFAQQGKTQPLLILDDTTGRPVDLELRGSIEQAISDAEAHPLLQEDDTAGPGRPKLGVKAREITLLPRHWAWLQAQPRSTSAALRRLVEADMKAEGQSAQLRQARDAFYRAMSALAGDLPGFEEASRALFADDRAGLAERLDAWPEDLRDYLGARLQAFPPAGQQGYLHPTRAAGGAFVRRQLQGPVVMLNLLRFRETADYRQAPALAPEAPISGREAYRRYMAAVGPLLAARGGALDFTGEGGAWLIGPEEGGWDLVLLVRHRSAADFLAFADDPDYQAVAGHRTAALEDSRLLPLVTST